MMTYDGIERRHCRFCSGQRRINHGDGVLVPCGACQYSDRQHRQRGASVPGIATIAVFREDNHGRYFSHTEYHVSHGWMSEVTRNKTAAPVLLKQYKELNQ